METLMFDWFHLGIIAIVVWFYNLHMANSLSEADTGLKQLMDFNS